MDTEDGVCSRAGPFGGMELPGQPWGESGCSHKEVMGNSQEMSKELLQVEGEEVGGCSGRADRAGELCQVRFECCVKQDGAACWERGQPAAGHEEGMWTGLCKADPAHSSSQPSSALSHNSKKQVKVISKD